MYKVFGRFLLSFFSRQTRWRLGRFLYMEARADVPNKMRTNGEIIVQSQFLHTFSDQPERLIVFDVGANIGDWTLHLIERSISLNICSNLDIYLFEPVPTTFQHLLTKLQQYRNKLNVHLESLALSDSDGSTQMFVYGETAGTNSLHQVAKRDALAIQVEIVSLDTYCAEKCIDVIHFLKCDTEGHEMRIITGAKRMFESERVKVCQFEYNHRWIFSRHYLRDVFDYFNGTSYSIGKITPDGIELYEFWHPELERFFEGNYLIIHSSALEWFAIKRGQFDLYNTYDSEPVEKRI